MKTQKSKLKNQKFKNQLNYYSQLTTHNSQRFNAFTIIELLISITIISILLGVSFAGYANLSQRQTLISAGQNFKNLLHDAQSRAISRELDCGIGKCDCTTSGNTQFSGWYVDFSSKSIYAKCGTYQFGDKEFKDYGISTDINITPFVIPQSTPIVFKNNPPGVSSTAYICISHKDLSSSFYILRVKDTGTISDDGGLVGVCPTPTP